MNVETFKIIKNCPELSVLSDDMVNLINLLSSGKKMFKNNLKENNKILKNPKIQLLKDKVENKVNLVLNKLSEINIYNLLSEFLDNLGKMNKEEYICVQRTFYIKIQADINFAKIYLEFFKIISRIYQQVCNYSSDYFYLLLENKFKADYLGIDLPEEFAFLEEFSDEAKRNNHLIILRTMININMLTTPLKTLIDKTLLEQNYHYSDIYFWFQNEELNNDQKEIIKKKTINTELPLREKILLDNLIGKKTESVQKTYAQKSNVKKFNTDTLKLEIENIVEEYLIMESFDAIAEFIKDSCKDALTKNKFCQFTFIKYFESSSDTCAKILELMKGLVKKQILFKSNLSRGLLLIHSNWNDLSLDFSTPGKKMKELLIFLKNMGITKALESLLKEYKIEFVESI
jgi:hypothetical protein